MAMPSPHLLVALWCCGLFFSVLHNKVICLWEIQVYVSPSLRDQQLTLSLATRQDLPLNHPELLLNVSSILCANVLSSSAGPVTFLGSSFVIPETSHYSCTRQTAPRLLSKEMGSLLWQLMKLWTMFSLCNNCKYFIFSWFPTKMIYSGRRDKDRQLTKPNFSLIAKTLSTHSSHIHPWILFVFLGMVELAVIGASNVSLVLHLQTFRAQSDLRNVPFSDRYILEHYPGQPQWHREIFQHQVGWTLQRWGKLQEGKIGMKIGGFGRAYCLTALCESVATPRCGSDPHLASYLSHLLLPNFLSNGKWRDVANFSHVLQAEENKNLEHAK